MVSNRNYYGQSTTGTANQIEDDVDFPHTGIIKALSDGLGQNYAISGFDITVDSATQIDVGAGVIFRDGKRLAVAGVNNLTLSASYTNGYHLLVANNHATAPVLEIRNPTAVNKVPEYRHPASGVAGADTIIAVITHTGSDPNIQYLTVHKTENSLSVGYDSSGYTEAMSVEGTSTKTTFHNKIADADIRFVLGDNTADEKFEIVTDDDADGDLTDTLTEVFSVNGLGATSIAGTVNLGSVVNAGTDTDKFLVLDSGGNVDFRTGTEVRSDIGAGTLSAESDTLDSVTGRGATTANSISVGTITSTANQNLAYEVHNNGTGPVMTGAKTVVYVDDITALTPANQVTLPPPAAGNILHIVNIGGVPITIVGNPVINLGLTTHVKIAVANQITLAPHEYVTLQGHNDSIAPLVTGHMIISD